MEWFPADEEEEQQQFYQLWVSMSIYTFCCLAYVVLLLLLTHFCYLTYLAGRILLLGWFSAASGTGLRRDLKPAPSKEAQAQPQAARGKQGLVLRQRPAGMMRFVGLCPSLVCPVPSESWHWWGWAGRA